MSETRQRWRLVFGRGEAARYLAHLDAVKLWERAFRRGHIPIARTEGFSPRPRLVFAAPLPLGMLAERELADLYLAERLTMPDLRERLVRDLPLGYELVDLHDVWIGEPSLASQLVAAEYRMRVAGAGAAELRAAAEALLGAARLNRERRREKKAIAYDLRPLILELRVAVEGDDGVELDMRLRHSQDAGSARADEVVLALAEVVGRELETLAAVRTRLWLAGELDAGTPSDVPAERPQDGRP